MSGIASSLSRYRPISNFPFCHSLNLGTRFLLGGRIVTPASRTVRSGAADGPPRRRPDIYMDGRGTCLSFLLLLLTSTSDERSSSARPVVALFPSISLLRPPHLDSLCEHRPQHLLHLPQPPARLLPAGIAPTAAGYHWIPLEACCKDHRGVRP